MIFFNRLDSIKKSTGLVWDPTFALHDAGPYPSTKASPVEKIASSDVPEIKLRTFELIERSGILGRIIRIEPYRAPIEAILSVHSQRLVDFVEKISEEGGDIELFAHLGKDGMRIAELAAGAGLAAVDNIYHKICNNIYVLSRPSGHHACHNRSMGYCIFNNAAIAARYAQSIGFERVVIIDIDVHHGNGTQSIFYDDPSVHTISTHQSGLYPVNTGKVDERGIGLGLNYNVNVPLPAGCGIGAYYLAFEKIISPVISKFSPQISIIVLGFDAHQNDPLGRMLLDAEGYRFLIRLLQKYCYKSGSNGVIYLQEGGYSPIQVPFCALAVLEEISGYRSGIVAPELESSLVRPGQSIQPHQREHITKICGMLKI